MPPLQRDAAEAFLYESEVQNGGHLQYFQNHGRERAESAIGALARLGARCQQELLMGALKIWTSANRKQVRTVEEYGAIALEGEFELFDRAYGECTPSMEQQLEHILAAHFDEFIELV